MMKPVSSVRHFLADELDSRRARNPSYSLRAFARDLGVSPAGLSQVLAGKQGLSRVAAQRMAKRLQLSEPDRDYLCDLAESEFARSAKSRAISKARLLKRQSVRVLDLEVFRVISDWHHFAIMELTEVAGFRSNARWIAQALRISEKSAQQAIDRLLALNLLERNPEGILRQTHHEMAAPSGIPSDAIKKFHLQILQKACEELYRQPIEHRDFSSAMVAINRSDIPKVKGWITEFRRGLLERIGKAPRGKDAIHCLSMQFFELTSFGPKGGSH